MDVKRIHDEGQTLSPPTGKVLGIVDSRADFDAVTRALSDAGFQKMYTLFGDEGIQLLERIHSFFFSDMEDRILQRHLDELKAGHLVFAVDTPADRVDEAVRIASESGAHRLVHFGALAVTWHTK